MNQKKWLLLLAFVCLQLVTFAQNNPNTERDKMELQTFRTTVKELNKTFKAKDFARAETLRGELATAMKREVSQSTATKNPNMAKQKALAEKFSKFSISNSTSDTDFQTMNAVLAEFIRLMKADIPNLNEKKTTKDGR